MALVYIPLSPWLFSLFTEVDEVSAAAIRQVRLLTIPTYGFLMTFVSGAVFQSTGSPFQPAIMQVIRAAVIIVVAKTMLSLSTNMEAIFVAIIAGNSVLIPICLAWTLYYLKRITFSSVSTS